MKILLIHLSLVLLFSFGAKAQIKVLPSGDFAIGQNYITNDDYKVEINGERKVALALSTRHETSWSWAGISKAINGTTKHWITSTNGYNNHTFWVYTWGEANAVSFRTWSDASFKQNIRPIENASHTISLLQPHIYDYIPGFNGSEYYDSSVFTNQPGFIAQELQEVLPYLVNPIDESGKLGVNYQGIIPVVVQCLKEQTIRIQELEENLAMCCQSSPNSERNSQNNSNNKQQPSSNTDLLAYEKTAESQISYTVVPNPNKGQFEIVTTEGTLLEADNVMITTLSGEKVNNISISPIANKVLVNMNGSRSGIYYVHIVKNNEVVSSKKVVINN
jgi:hypothetical protein